MILFINACVRENSRTLHLAKDYISYYNNNNEPVTEVELCSAGLYPLGRDTLEKRESYIEEGNFTDEMFAQAHLLKQADRIIIAAPYWDYSFPSLIKVWIEQLCVMGLTFDYSSEGIPTSLCSLNELVYITTAGGYIPGRNFGYDYVCEVFTSFFGVKKCRCIKAEGLDIAGNDPEEIIKMTKREYRK